ncbi:MAG TPA: YtxH domain-containing protein [Polyangiaceae bacterium]|nr:YtxH domain-containing protein [Polyangiaceae bacterium]
MNNWSFLTSLGTALASSKLAKNITTIEPDDLLAIVGLARSRNQAWSNVALFGLGALAGAGAALLLAPASGRETRARLSDQLDRLAEVANDAVQEATAEAPALLSRVTGAAQSSEAQRAQRS